MPELELRGLEEYVHDLERYKRRLGRRYENATDHLDRVWYFCRYNEVENTIRKLVDMFNIERIYQPYKLDIRTIGGNQQ